MGTNKLQDDFYINLESISVKTTHIGIWVVNHPDSGSSRGHIFRMPHSKIGSCQIFSLKGPILTKNFNT
jgi:hypothetical protein